MRFTYTYRSSDGQRHTAEIDAPSRDEAFAAIRREMGVKPIKVVAAGGVEAQSDGDAPKVSVWKIVAFILFIGLSAICGVAWWLAARQDARPYQLMTPQGPVTYSVADPLPRQAIPGDRARIGAAMGAERVFKYAAEAYLARYAEPGRAVENELHRVERDERTAGGSAPKNSLNNALPSEAEFRACLRESVFVASTDFTEVVDLKRIVAGMKREMRAYLAGGGTVEQYLVELTKRQKLEISYRERAEQKLNEMLIGERGRGRLKPETRNQKLQSAYAYWLKANASLRAMGIYQIEIPSELQSYQMSLDIDSEEGVPVITQKASVDAVKDGAGR